VPHNVKSFIALLLTKELESRGPFLEAAIDIFDLYIITTYRAKNRSINAGIMLTGRKSSLYKQKFTRNKNALSRNFKINSFCERGHSAYPSKQGSKWLQ
jgi:hypothetical protein